MNEPNPAAINDFCLTWLPNVLVESYKFDRSEAEAVGCDVLDRAEAFAALDEAATHVLIAPFIEEVSDYEPREATAFLKAAVTVVVRNSQLEEGHAHGSLGSGGIKIITETAARPLSHLLAARRRLSMPLTGANPFDDLDQAFPRAWAALSALVTALERGGRVGYRTPDAPTPATPDAAEIVAAQPSKQHESAVVESAIDHAFNQQLVDTLHQAIAAGNQSPFVVPSLSRISRNSTKQLRVIEILLAHDVPILTTNYLLRSSDVWVRRAPLITPDSYSNRPGLDDVRGLSGAHRKLVEAIAEILPR